MDSRIVEKGNVYYFWYSLSSKCNPLDDFSSRRNKNNMQGILFNQIPKTHRSTILKPVTLSNLSYIS